MDKIYRKKSKIDEIEELDVRLTANLIYKNIY